MAEPKYWRDMDEIERLVVMILHDNAGADDRVMARRQAQLYCGDPPEDLVERMNASPFARYSLDDLSEGDREWVSRVTRRFQPPCEPPQAKA